MTRTYKNKAELQAHVISILTENKIESTHKIYIDLIELTANKTKIDIRDTKLNIVDKDNNIIALFDDKFNAYFTTSSFKATERNKSKFEHMTIKATKLHLVYKREIDELKITKEQLTADFLSDKLDAIQYKAQLQQTDKEINEVKAIQTADYTINQYNEIFAQLKDSLTNVIVKDDKLSKQYKIEIFA